MSPQLSQKDLARDVADGSPFRRYIRRSYRLCWRPNPAPASQSTSVSPKAIPHHLSRNWKPLSAKPSRYGETYGTEMCTRTRMAHSRLDSFIFPSSRWSRQEARRRLMVRFGLYPAVGKALWRSFGRMGRIVGRGRKRWCIRKLYLYDHCCWVTCARLMLPFCRHNRQSSQCSIP